MVQVIQIKRKFTGAGVPTNLAPGELAYNNTGDKLYVGGDLNTVKGLVGSERQLEVHATSPAQPVLGGAKTFSAGAAGTLKVTGGNVGEFLSISNVDGTLTYQPMVSASQQFVGSFKGSDGSITFTAQSGHPGPGLPAPAIANNGHYVIADTAGATVPAGAGAGVTGPFEIGDWIISNGATWTHLKYGGISSVTAADVGVVAPVTGGDDVQEVLESLEAADAAGAAADAAQDLLIAANAAAIAVNAADITAIEGVNTAQDTAIANKITKPTIAPTAAFNIAVFADTTGTLAFDGGVTVADIYDAIDLKQDIATANAGDVVGPAGAIANNIAVFDTATGKLIKDGLTPISALATTAALTAEQLLDVKIAGSTMTGALILHASPLAADPPLQAATKQYVTDAIGSIPGAAPPLVTAPELTGDGTTGSAITFTGITTAEHATGVAGPAFSGKGLSTDPLMLLCVDGGEYV